MRRLALRRSHKWLAAIAAVLLLAYALAGFFLVPRLARTQLESFVAEKLQRRISIGEIRFNPFTLAADIDDLKLGEADGAPLLAFRHLRVDAELASLWRLGIVLKEVAFTAPEVDVVVAPDGSVNLARLIPPAPAAAPAAEESAAPLRVTIASLSVTDGRVGVQDLSLAPPFRAAFTPIRFSLTDFSTELGHRNAYSFRGTSAIGARLEWDGEFTLQPLGSSGRFRIGDLHLAALDRYLESRLPVEVVSGSAELNGEYRFRLQPLSLEVALPAVGVRDLALAERGVAAPPPLTLPQIDVQQLAFSLERREVSLQRLAVRGAHVELARERDGSFNLARLVPPPAPAPADAQRDARPWSARVETFAIEAATLLAQDRSVSPAAQLHLAPIDITVGGWSTLPGTRMKLDANIGIEGKGRLAAAGELGLQPLAAALAVELERFPLPVLQPYLSRATGLMLHSGNLGVKAKVALAPAAKVSGELRIDGVRASDDLVREDLFRWRSLALTGIEFQQSPQRLRIARVVAREPYARVVIAQNGTTNVARALVSDKADDKAPDKADDKAPAGARMPIAIGEVRVVDGAAHFADYSVEPSFASGIVALNGRVAGLSSAPGSRASVALQGKVDEFSPVDIAGKVNLLSAALYSDVALRFSNIELTTFNPYSGKFAGYAIRKGKLSTEMKYRVENRKLDAQHHIVVDNLEFGDATHSKDAAPIPVKLAVALLKDRRGIIDLELPVSGTLDDPEFRLGPLIWKAVVNLLGKIVAAPFAAIGALFGGGEELAFVDFAPASAALGEPMRERLGTLAKALAERPELRLEVPLTAAPSADGLAVAKQALDALVPPVDPAQPLDEDAQRGRLEALEAVYVTQLGAAPEYPAENASPQARIDWLQAALLERLKPAPAALEELARQRAQAVRATLLANSELAPERVFLVANPAEAAIAGGLVRMEMKLE
ncbi:MAG TPA: DUF748 domain-containing protein [Burkholderiales bacterium]|nr:DUF748 domain-containing protein [Burkholderiales bacterium]